MYKPILIFFLLVALFSTKAISQENFIFKAEAGYLVHQYYIIDVDPGPQWRGYYIEQTDGFETNLIGNIAIHDKVLVGIGVGYIRFAEDNGLSAFSSLEYLPLKKRLSPLVHLRIGYSHIWNQYPGGRGTPLGEAGMGLNYKINAKNGIYVMSSIMAVQQSLIIPMRIGFRF